MITSLSSFWAAIWPNLAANVVWIPIVGAHHWWTRHKMAVLHETMRELHLLLGVVPSVKEQRMTSINWGSVFKSPQAIISLLTAVVATAGTAGIINTTLTGAIQALLVAILGVVSAIGHVAASAKVVQRQAQKALEGGETK